MPKLTAWFSLKTVKPTIVGWYNCTRGPSFSEGDPVRSWWDGKDMRGVISSDYDDAPTTGDILPVRINQESLSWQGQEEPSDNYPYPVAKDLQ